MSNTIAASIFSTNIENLPALEKSQIKSEILVESLTQAIAEKRLWLDWLMQDENFYNLLALLAACLCFFACWYWSHRYQKAQSIARLNLQMRVIWVKFFSEGKIDPMVAINALRNSILVGTALSSAVILFTLALFSLFGNVPRLYIILQNLPFHTSNQAWLGFKVLCLIIWQMAVFFCFTTSIRYYRHCSFMISIPFSQMNYQTQLLNIYMHRAANYYSTGQKLMLFSIPLCAWLLGNVVFLSATLVTTYLVYLADRFED